MKKLIFACLAAALGLAAQAVNLRFSYPEDAVLMWNAPDRPCVSIMLRDSLGVANHSRVSFYVTPDVDESTRITSVTFPVDIAAGDSLRLDFDVDIPQPGFYKCFVADDDNLLIRFHIVYEPTNIVSLPDEQPDFDEFWATALEELAAVPGNYKMTENTAMSGKSRRVFDVEMQSAGGETIKGQLYMPRKKGRYPARVYLNGYGCMPWTLDTERHADWIELITGVRGQVFTHNPEKYGQWVCYNIDNRDDYFYRGAYLDIVRFVDFIEQLPETDTDLIFAEGGSQGGGLALAIAGLDPRIKGIATCCPFLTDWPDYFRIEAWPGNILRDMAASKGITEEQMMVNLSYFDMKNFARRITCPVLFAMGLQDPLVPPHTNIASYNLLTVPKEITIYPRLGHAVDNAHWDANADRFFGDIIHWIKSKRVAAKK